MLNVAVDEELAHLRQTYDQLPTLMVNLNTTTIEKSSIANHLKGELTIPAHIPATLVYFPQFGYLLCLPTEFESQVAGLSLQLQFKTEFGLYFKNNQLQGIAIAIISC